MYALIHILKKNKLNHMIAERHFGGSLAQILTAYSSKIKVYIFYS